MGERQSGGIGHHFAACGQRAKACGHVHRVADHREVPPLRRSDGTGDDLAGEHAGADATRQSRRRHCRQGRLGGGDGAPFGVRSFKAGQQGIADHFVHVAAVGLHGRHLQRHQAVEEADHRFRRRLFRIARKVAHVGVKQRHAQTPPLLPAAVASGAHGGAGDEGFQPLAQHHQATGALVYVGLRAGHQPRQKPRQGRQQQRRHRHGRGQRLQQDGVEEHLPLVQLENGGDAAAAVVKGDIEFVEGAFLAGLVHHLGTVVAQGCGQRGAVVGLADLLGIGAEGGRAVGAVDLEPRQTTVAQGLGEGGAQVGAMGPLPYRRHRLRALDQRLPAGGRFPCDEGGDGLGARLGEVEVDPLHQNAAAEGREDRKAQDKGNQARQDAAVKAPREGKRRVHRLQGILIIHRLVVGGGTVRHGGGLVGTDKGWHDS